MNYKTQTTFQWTTGSNIMQENHWWLLWPKLLFFLTSSPPLSRPGVFDLELHWLAILGDDDAVHRSQLGELSLLFLIVSLRGPGACTSPMTAGSRARWNFLLYSRSSVCDGDGGICISLYNEFEIFTGDISWMFRDVCESSAHHLLAMLLEFGIVTYTSSLVG